MAKRLTEDTLISGAEWRDFYQNHWPEGHWIDDCMVEFEDDEGNWVLADDEQHPLRDYGTIYLDNEAIRDSTAVSSVELFRKYRQQREGMIAIKASVPADSIEKLMAFIDKLGGTIEK